jgi:hypothetical protein
MAITLDLGPMYSVDANALIYLKFQIRRTVFRSAWAFVGQMADAGRLIVCEEAADEVRDSDIQSFIKEHCAMIRRFQHVAHQKALVAEAEEHNLRMVDHTSTKNRADEFVIALALMCEGRDLSSLRRAYPGGPKCAVLSYESQRKRPANLAKIPDVCGFYGLRYMQWLDMFEDEGFVC